MMMNHDLIVVKIINIYYHQNDQLSSDVVLACTLIIAMHNDEIRYKYINCVQLQMLAIQWDHDSQT